MILSKWLVAHNLLIPTRNLLLRFLKYEPPTRDSHLVTRVFLNHPIYPENILNDGFSSHNIYGYFFLKKESIKFSFLFSLYFQQKTATKLSMFH